MDDQTNKLDLMIQNTSIITSSMARVALITELVDLQKDYCKHNYVPMFIPMDGFCSHCIKPVFRLDDPNVRGTATGNLITNCPHCSRSFID